MRYPCLVAKRMCKTQIHIDIEREGLNKYGEQLEAVSVDTLCNYQDSSKTILTAEKKLITLSGVALIPGDIAPELPNIAGGSITVNGVERSIFSGKKARNPDGTVNYTEIDVK